MPCKEENARGAVLARERPTFSPARTVRPCSRNAVRKRHEETAGAWLPISAHRDRPAVAASRGGRGRTGLAAPAALVGRARGGRRADARRRSRATDSVAGIERDASWLGDRGGVRRAVLLHRALLRPDGPPARGAGFGHRRAAAENA